MFDKDEDDWTVPEKKWALRRGPILLCIAMFVTGALVALLVTSLRTGKEEPVQAEPEQIGLTAREEAGVKATLGRLTVGAHKVTGTVTSRGTTLTVDLSYNADRSSGAGTITAGTVTGEALLDVDVMFLRGPAEFWNAMRVTPLTTENADKTWVAMDPRFMDGGIFQSAETVADALAPTSTAKLESDGNYKPAADAVDTAKLSAAGEVVEYTVNGVSVKVNVIDPATIATIAGPFLESRTEWATIAGDPDTSWRLNPPGEADRPPAPEPSGKAGG